MKLFRAIAFSLCILMVSAGTGCSGEKIESVESIMATYGTNSSRIYPSNINAYEIEQAYTQWDIYVSADVTVFGIEFSAAKLGEANDLRVKAELISGEQTVELCPMTQISFSEKTELDFFEGQLIKIEKGENSSRQILRLTFESGDGVKFRLSGFRLTRN